MNLSVIMMFALTLSLAAVSAPETDAFGLSDSQMGCSTSPVPTTDHANRKSCSSSAWCFVNEHCLKGQCVNKNFYQCFSSFDCSFPDRCFNGVCRR